MAVTNIAYKECTCDACGKVAKADHSIFLPKDWDVIKIGTRNLDLCDVCFTKVCAYINSLCPKGEEL